MTAQPVQAHGSYGDELKFQGQGIRSRPGASWADPTDECWDDDRDERY